MDYFFRNHMVITDYVPTDIYPIQYGEQQCHPDYAFGPSVRSNYILHYVYSGKGILRVNNSEFEILPGHLFLIKPNQLAFYKADSDDPWLYRWIEFNGSLSEKILSAFDNKHNIPVIADCDEMLIGNKFIEFVSNANMNFEAAMEKMWSLISVLVKNPTEKQQVKSQDYIRIAEAYIKNNIHSKITVTDLAHHIGINRSYLCRLFKEYKNISPQQYILTIKLNTAAQYLKNTDISIIEAANSVGYDDYHVFNQIFKRHFNISPSGWRKKQFWEKSFIE